MQNVNTDLSRRENLKILKSNEEWLESMVATLSMALILIEKDGIELDPSMELSIKKGRIMTEQMLKSNKKCQKQLGWVSMIKDYWKFLTKPQEKEE